MIPKYKAGDIVKTVLNEQWDFIEEVIPNAMHDETAYRLRSGGVVTTGQILEKLDPVAD